MREEAPAKSKRGRKQKRAEMRGEDPVTAERFARLRDWRRTEAAAAGIAPYMIFSDKTLMGVAQIKPQVLADLSLVSGIGEVKLKKYGPALLALLKDAA